MPNPSPFPGLDPYLESHWGDVHHRLTQYASDILQESLPDDLLARVEERVFVECEDVRLRSIAPDTRVVEWRPGGEATTAESVGGIAVAEPRVVILEEEEITEGYIEIRERHGGRVVTVIEFLSPANKAGGEGTRAYRAKQKQILHSDTSLVEIDLVRAGLRVLAVPEHHFPPEWRSASQACIVRSWQRPKYETYGFPLREPLPALGIPLRSHEKAVPLDLQALLNQCYQKGRYDTLDYSVPPFPPLSRDEVEWADSLLQAAGRRR